MPGTGNGVKVSDVGLRHTTNTIISSQAKGERECTPVILVEEKMGNGVRGGGKNAKDKEATVMLLPGALFSESFTNTRALLGGSEGRLEPTYLRELHT